MDGQPLPCLHQWHGQIDLEYRVHLSTVYQSYYDQQRHALRMTDEQIEAVRIGE